MAKCIRQRCSSRVEYDDLCTKHMTAEMDRLFSLYIRRRDAGFCQRCGSKDRVQCSHHIRRSRSSAVKWDPLNACAHCSRCHEAFTHDEVLHQDWVRRAFLGEEDYAALLDRAYGPLEPYTGRRVGPERVDRVETLEWLREEMAA